MNRAETEAAAAGGGQRPYGRILPWIMRRDESRLYKGEFLKYLRYDVQEIRG